MIRPYHILRTCFPLAEGSFEAVLSSQAALEQACPDLPAFVALLQNSDPIGRLGNYKAIYVISATFGGFTPILGANPTQGQIDVPETGRTVEVKTYASMDLPMETIYDFIDRMADIHPWEHPPVELSTVQLWFPH
jgi:hypothetical protein